jgi:hypothetical protein
VNFGGTKSGFKPVYDWNIFRQQSCY